MSTKTYLILCAIIAVATALSVLYMPGLSDTIEQYMLFFLSTNAR